MNELNIILYYTQCHIHRKYGKRQTMRSSFQWLGRKRLIDGNNVALQTVEEKNCVMIENTLKKKRF